MVVARGIIRLNVMVSMSGITMQNELTHAHAKLAGCCSKGIAKIALVSYFRFAIVPVLV